MGQTISHASPVRSPDRSTGALASPASSISTTPDSLAASVAEKSPLASLRLPTPSGPRRSSSPIPVPASPSPKRHTPRYACVSQGGKVAPLPNIVQQLYPNTIAACGEIIAQLDRGCLLPQSADWNCLGAGLHLEDILSLEPATYSTLPKLLLIHTLEKQVSCLADGKPQACETEIFDHSSEEIASIARAMLELTQGSAQALARLSALLRNKIAHGDAAWSADAAAHVFNVDAHDPTLRRLMRRIGQVADATLKGEENLLAGIVHVAGCIPGASRLSRVG